MGNVLKNDYKSSFPIILCCLFSLIDILLNTEIIYLIPSEYLSLIKYLIAAVVIFYLFLNLFYTKIGTAEYLLFFLLLVTAGVFVFGETLHPLMLVIFLYLFRSYKFEVILKPLYLMLISVFAFTVFMSVTDVYPNLSYSREETVRYALGFLTPTLGQSVLLFALLSKFYLKKRTMSVLSIAVYAVLISAMYYFTAGRTGFYLGVFALLCIVLYKIICRVKKSNNTSSKKGLAYFAALIPVACLLLSLLMTKLYADGNEFAVELNHALSTRLLLQHKAFLERTVTLFGQSITWADESGIYIGIDNSYLYHLFNYGIIIFALAIFMYCLMLKRAVNNGNYTLVLVVIIILIDALVEPYLIDFKYNFFVFYPMLIVPPKDNVIVDSKKIIANS